MAKTDTRTRAHPPAEIKRRLAEAAAINRDELRIRAARDEYRPKARQRLRKTKWLHGLVHEHALEQGRSWPLDGATRGIPDDLNVPGLKTMMRAVRSAGPLLPPPTAYVAGAVDDDNSQNIRFLLALDRGLRFEEALQTILVCEALEAGDMPRARAILNSERAAWDALRRKMNPSKRKGKGASGVYRRWLDSLDHRYQNALRFTFAGETSAGRRKRIAQLAALRLMHGLKD